MCFRSVFVAVFVAGGFFERATVNLRLEQVPGDEQVRFFRLRAGQTPAAVVLQLGFDVADFVGGAAARRAGAAVAPFRAESTHQSRGARSNQQSPNAVAPPEQISKCSETRPEKIFVTPLRFFAPQVRSVVLVSAFVIVSTVTNHSAPSDCFRRCI